MIEHKKIKQNHWKKKEIINAVGENPTADEVLDFLIGDDDGRSASDYVVYKYEARRKTLFQRVNLLWFFPLYIATIPFQWVIIGRIGINRNGMVGSVVNWLVGFD